MSQTNVSTEAQPDSTNLVDIIRTRLATGAGLPAERLLAEELNVTRHQLRRALNVLRLQGELATTAPRRSSSSVRGREALIRDTNPLEVIELRLALEPGFARLAALRATPVDIARIQKASVTLAGANRALTDHTFHKLVAAASGNTLIADFYNLLRQIGSDARLHVSRSTSQGTDRIKQRDIEHASIAAAIAARDPDWAEAAMRAHLMMVQAQIMNRINPMQLDTPPAAAVAQTAPDLA